MHNVHPFDTENSSTQQMMLYLQFPEKTQYSSVAMGWSFARDCCKKCTIYWFLPHPTLGRDEMFSCVQGNLPELK